MWFKFFPPEKEMSWAQVSLPLDATIDVALTHSNFGSWVGL